MTKLHRLVSLLIAGAAGAACLDAIADSPRVGQPAAASAAVPQPYRTQLFNLLDKEAGIIDGKNWYQAGFARQFDALLASSSLAKADKVRVPLKKRLLSGPAPLPSLQTDPATGVQWIVYDACQAHRCDEISLRLLYDPAARRMVGQLKLDKQTEFLGAPSASEQRLLEKKHAQAAAQAPLDRIMASLIDYKVFRMNSDSFDRLVAPDCKRTDRQKDEHGVDAEYSCAASTGITEMKISTREDATPAKSYVMYIQLFLKPDRYAPLKSALQGKLGKPKKSGKDFVRYEYTGDKELGKLGTPVISLSREDDQTVGFSVALEQGP